MSMFRVLFIYIFFLPSIFFANEYTASTGKTFLATDFNDKGQVIGGCYPDNPTGIHSDSRPFFWGNGVVADMGPGSEFSKNIECLGYHVVHIQLISINNMGEIAGYFAFDNNNGIKNKSGIFGCEAFFWNGNLHILPIPEPLKDQPQLLHVNDIGSVLLYNGGPDTYLWSVEEGLVVIHNFLATSFDDSSNIILRNSESGPAVWNNGVITVIDSEIIPKNISETVLQSTGSYSTIGSIEKTVKRIMIINKTSLRIGQVRRISEFIEKNFAESINKGIYYLYGKDTGLPCDLEYDPESQTRFIHTDEFVGRGSVKEIVTKSILYDAHHSIMAAKARTRGGPHVMNEIATMKKLNAVNRTVQLIAAPSHRENAHFVQEIITPLYNAGDLQDISKKINLTMKEKVVLSMDLMEALKGIHALKIAHEDIHDANILLEENASPYLTGIKYRLVLIDMGKAVSMQSDDVLARKDVYAAGCTLYGLLHNQGYTGFLYDKLNAFSKPSPKHGGLLLGELSSQLTNRKTDLDRKNRTGTINLEERFEWIIIGMLHPVCDDTRDAAYWYGELLTLLQKLT